MMDNKLLFPALLHMVIALVVCTAPAGAMKDPSAVYCGAMGYTYTIADTPEGPLGVCVLPDDSKVDSFRFLQGLEGTQYSYCAREGYQQKIVTSYRTCGQFGLDQCLVCTLPDGTTGEVTHLMNLSFAETICGDKSCGRPEDAISCPTDCPSGGRDMHCDRIADGRCDPDCLDGTVDPDCGGAAPGILGMTFIAGLAVLAIAGAGIYMFLTRKRSP
jgi:putative hemolysin